MSSPNSRHLAPPIEHPRSGRSSGKSSRSQSPNALQRVDEHTPSNYADEYHTRSHSELPQSPREIAQSELEKTNKAMKKLEREMAELYEEVKYEIQTDADDEVANHKAKRLVELFGEDLKPVSRLCKTVGCSGRFVPSKSENTVHEDESIIKMCHECQEEAQQQRKSDKSC